MTNVYVHDNNNTTVIMRISSEMRRTSVRSNLATGRIAV